MSQRETMGLVCCNLCAILFFVGLCFCLKRFRENKNLRNSPRLCTYKGVHFLELAIFVAIVMFISIVKSESIVRNNREGKELAPSFTNEQVSFEGYILSEPDKKHSYQYIEVKLLEDIFLKGLILTKDHGYILVKTENYEKFIVGQVCKFTGLLVEPESFSDFDYKTYLNNKEIFLIMENPQYICSNIFKRRGGSAIKNSLIDFKEKIIDKIDKVLQEPQSSLLAGILFGKKRLFSTDFDDNVRVAGVSHVVAASGYNITILVVVINRILFFCSKKVKIVLGIVIIWLFAVLSGLSSSIVRACIMSTLSLFALLWGRNNTIHFSLPLASAVFVFFKPMIILDVGFLLSVSATLGLIYILPILISLKEKTTTKLKILDDYLFPTMSCTLSTLPVSLMTFKSFSLWSIPVNTLILPVIEGTMLWGVLSIVLIGIYKSLSYFFFTIVNLQLRYFEYIVDLVGELNMGSWEVVDARATVFSVISILGIAFLVIYLYPIDNEKYNYYLKDR